MNLGEAAKLIWQWFFSSRGQHEGITRPAEKHPEKGAGEGHRKRVEPKPGTVIKDVGKILPDHSDGVQRESS